MKRIEDDDLEEGSDVDEDVYTEEGREELLEEDELDDNEAAFMEGYENSDLVYCDNCKKNLTEDDEENIVEDEVNGKKLRFCSEDCKEEYYEKKV